MAVRTLQELLEQDSRIRAGVDTVLTEEEFRNIISVAAPVFREDSLRPALPVQVVNMPGKTKSRHIKVIDMDPANHGMSGTGGTFSRLDKSLVDVLAYAMWHNVEVPWREQEASQEGGIFDILRESGIAIGEKLRELENQFIVDGLGPVKGITNTSGIDTFASADTWATAGIFWQDILKARGRLKSNKIPVDQLAVLANPADITNAWQVFASTATPQAKLAEMERMFPGGVYENTNVDVGKAYVYARTPTVLELVVYQDLTVKPLPMMDEDPRARGRVIDALHVKSPLGVCEISSI